MLQPGLTNLFESLVIIRATAHSIQILWNNWMIGLRQCEPIQVFGSGIARSRCNPAAHLCSCAAELLHIWQIANNHIGTGTRSRSRLVQRWDDRRSSFSVDERPDL